MCKRELYKKSANLWMSHILKDMKTNHLHPFLTFPSWKSLYKPYFKGKWT